jgi:hypothetical protein
VNLIYFYAYSYAYGARYPTRYRHSHLEDFGRLNLMGRVVAEAHRRGIRVVAWVYVLRHRGSWEAHPEWRSLTASGKAYQSGADQYFLSPHHPEAVRWWVGFLDDLLRAVPDIDGVDLAEPVVNWWGAEADYSDAARRALARRAPGARAGDDAWRRLRAEALSDVLRHSAALVKRYGRQVHITTVLTPRADGTFLSQAEQAAQTGFDLEAVLDGTPRPDVLNIELIFQQWAASHRASTIFTPEWTARAARAARAHVRGRAGVIVHVELSQFGGVAPLIPEFARVLRALQADGHEAVDIYAAHLLDAVGAWEVVGTAFSGRMVSRGLP